MLTEVQTVNVDGARTSVFAPVVTLLCGDVRFGSEELRHASVGVDEVQLDDMGWECSAHLNTMLSSGRGTTVDKACICTLVLSAACLHSGETVVAAPKNSFHTAVTVVAAPSGRRT